MEKHFFSSLSTGLKKKKKEEGGEFFRFTNRKLILYKYSHPKGQKVRNRYRYNQL